MQLTGLIFQNGPSICGIRWERREREKVGPGSYKEGVPEISLAMKT